MKFTHAVITAASPDQRRLLLQTLVDRDGQTKTALQILLEEVADAGIEECHLVIRPSDAPEYQAATESGPVKVSLVEQPEPHGYGHAVWCARDAVGDSPFLLMVGDHLYLSQRPQRCARQLLEVAAARNCAVSAVQPTHESKLNAFGAIGGRLANGTPGIYEVNAVLEKPTPTEAEQTLVVPGLRAGYYLCFFGMHVLMPSIFGLLEEAMQANARPITLSPSLRQLAARERYLACEIGGTRYDIGTKYGLLTAQLALGLDGQDREEILSMMVELLAARQASK